MRAAECPGAIRRKASSPCLGQDAAGRRGRGSTVNDALKNLAVGRVVIIKVPLCGTGCAVLPTLPPCMLIVVCTMTLPRWSEVRQTDGSLVIKGRLIARVAAPFPNRARTVAWANQARILQGRASIHRSCSWTDKRPM